MLVCQGRHNQTPTKKQCYCLDTVFSVDRIVLVSKLAQKRPLLLIRFHVIIASHLWRPALRCIALSNGGLVFGAISWGPGGVVGDRGPQSRNARKLSSPPDIRVGDALVEPIIVTSASSEQGALQAQRYGLAAFHESRKFKISEGAPSHHCSTIVDDRLLQRIVYGVVR